jgi:acetyltransferase-like isoleucine patch superfamily enzyme
MPKTSTSAPITDLRDAHRRLREFRQGKTRERLFTHPIDHPALTTGFCYCERSFWKATIFIVKAMIIAAVFKLPLNRLKVWILRRFGAQVGEDVFFSAGVWIDPTFPELITIEDKVFFGMNAKIFNHEYRRNEFRAGKAIVRSGTFIGGYAVIAPGVEIGENAVLSAFAVAIHNVPPDATLVAAPPRIIKRSNCDDLDSSKDLS